MTIKVVSLSLGSSSGDYCYSGEVVGHNVEIIRIGFNGELGALKQALTVWDGQVPYIALGGLNFFYKLGGYRYAIPEAQDLSELLTQSKLVDGSGWKEVWDPWVIDLLVKEDVLRASHRILCTSALDRWDLCVALEKQGLRVGVGDALFALKLPLIFPGTKFFAAIGCLTMPMLRRLPIAWLYPTGERQDQQQPIWSKLVSCYDVYIGDTHFLNTFGPIDYQDKIVIGSTLNEIFLQRLKGAKVRGVYALQPVLGTRVFGANVWEALALSVSGSIKNFITEHSLRPSVLFHS